MSDDDIRPKLGRGKAGTKDAKRLASYAGRIARAARLAGAQTGVRQRRFDGSRIGRGASMARLLSSRDGASGSRTRRAVVKTRLVRLGPKGLATARAHLRYIQRDGVTREGAPGELYSRDLDQADGKAFLERATGDRHQFRFIVSAEDGAEYPDLKPYVRRLMTQVEADLGTKLDWVAVDHFNTERPHSHLMLRGVDDQGENLVIAREYIAHGFRERAGELATLDLGPRTDQEIENRMRHEVGQERLTSIDRKLLRRMDADRIVTAADRDPFRQALTTGRLRKLAEMGLADDIAQGRYRLADSVDDTLRRMGERGDIIRTMQRELTQRRLERTGVDQVIVDADTGPTQPIVGRVIARGFADEHRDRHYLLVDGVDGRVHHVGIGRADAVEPTPEGMVVRATPRDALARPADRTVAEVAAAYGGRYSVDLHLQHDASATQAFAQAHVRRLEAMRRAGTGFGAATGAGAQREADGSWIIPADHVERAASYEQRQWRERPVTVETLSPVPIERLGRANAATWLDRELAAADPLAIRDAGFGREVRDALAVRRQWLVEQELADADGDRVSLRVGSLAALQRRELLSTAATIEQTTGKSFVEAREGASVEGRLTRRLDLVSGRFALVENARDFTLVPWRPVLERQLGNEVGGMVRADGISWRIGRGRGGPEIG